MRRIRILLRYYFNLIKDRDEEALIVASIVRQISFRGANLWTLIFAVIIASIGLNVNATAVIIGAMLISPLMGPIMGVGLGIGILDFDLVRRGLKNLLIAAIFSIATSTLYFYMTPLHNPTSELLARTSPTIWDVFIAFTGGVAGIIGVTRKERGNVIPGVAIATALMPPLCTAGYGLANGQWFYFIGALYLFFINSVFICIATILILRFMNFQRHVIKDESRRKKVTTYIVIVVIITIVPSIWLAVRIVNKAIFENAAGKYVRSEFNFVNTQVVNKVYSYNTNPPKIELLLIGEVLDSLKIDTLKRRLPAYSLKGTNLLIRQGINARQEIDFAQVKASILDEMFKNQDTLITPATVVAEDNTLPDISAELIALYPQVDHYALERLMVIRADSPQIQRPALMLVARSRTTINLATRRSMLRWLSAKFPSDSIQVVVQRID